MKSPKLKKSVEKKTSPCKRCSVTLAQEKSLRIEEHKRHLAELENARKRNRQEQINLMKYQNYDFAKELLVVWDYLQRALSFTSHNPETKKFLIGVQMAVENFEKILNQFGINKILVKVGDQYKSEQHQTTGSAWNSQYKENSILKIQETGFMLHERLLRPAKVMINLPKQTDNQNDKKKIKEN